MTQITNRGIDSGNQLLILKNMCQKIVILVRPDKPIKKSQSGFSANPHSTTSGSQMMFQC